MRRVITRRGAERDVADALLPPGTMPDLRDPSDIFDRAADEGRRRLDQSTLELVATGFSAGFTIVFGLVALAILHAAASPRLGELAEPLGALGFAAGLVLLVVGRAELFSENFFDPVAAAIERREGGLWWRIARLWSVTLGLNLVGGIGFGLVVTVDGLLEPGAREALARVASEIVGRGAVASFVAAVVGGALVALLSYLLHAAGSVGGRIAVTFLVGFLLALGPFDHVVVTVLHALLGLRGGAPVDLADLVRVAALAAAGNLVGGIGLVTLSHAAQARGGRRRGR